MTTSVRRCALWLGGSILLGLLTTASTAAVIAAFGPPKSLPKMRPAGNWSRSMPQLEVRHARNIALRMQWTSLGCVAEQLTVYQTADVPRIASRSYTRVANLNTVECGIPFHAFQGRVFSKSSFSEPSSSTAAVIAFKPVSRVIPLFPIWPGLLANTAIFSIAWMLLLAGPRFRAALLRRRNLCPHCSYPRTGLAPGAPCPECGLSA